MVAGAVDGPTAGAVAGEATAASAGAGLVAATGDGADAGTVVGANTEAGDGAPRVADVSTTSAIAAGNATTQAAARINAAARRPKHDPGTAD